MKLTIRAKIISGFAMVFAISMIIGFYGLYGISQVAVKSEKQVQLQEAEASILNVLSAHYVWRQNLSIAVFTNTDFSGSYDPVTCALGKWRNDDTSMETADDEIMALLNRIDEPHNYIHQEAEVIMNMMKSGDPAQMEQAHHEFTEKILPKADEAIGILTEMTQKYNKLLEAQTIEISQYEENVKTVIIVLIVIGTVLCLCIIFAILKSIMKPLRALAETASKVANGNFQVKLTYAVNDEIGVLTRNFSQLVDTFKLMIQDLHKMSEQHSAGQIDYFIQKDKYQGEFQLVVTGINKMIAEYLDNTNAILDVADNYANGNFNAKLQPLPGEKAKANIVLDNVLHNLRGVEESILYLVDSAINGELDKSVDVSGFKGGWHTIISNMNKLLESVDAPLVETQTALSMVSQGKMDAYMTGEYKGQFKKMAETINRTIDVLSMYIKDISSSLNELASDNFDIAVTKDYVGDFNAIKNSLNTIIDRLNNVMSEIGGSADQVAAGAKMISEASISLAQGASEQASAVEELNSSIDEIQEQTRTNSQNSTAANELAIEARQNAGNGNAEMNAMLTSMEGINTASQNISKIIKVIDDIAFQTNLLALNAAVEAARAGEHGKGFSVVAEEVRNLAARSKNAAKETTDLIEQSIVRVNEGTSVANNTAKALLTIVEGVTDVSHIIDKIETASKEQASSISQIQSGIVQISQVTQQNSSTSEESASAAEQLSSQSEVLKSMIGKFKLRRI